ncbi:MAG: F0F1 ATP synthase subunit alpha [Patescibacteria group bacterium]
MKTADQYVEEIEKNVDQFQPNIKQEEVGWVTQNKDGIVNLRGLTNVTYSELIEFESGVQAMVIDLLPDEVGAIVLGDYLTIKAGDMAKATGKTLSIPMSEEVLGRVVNPLNEPIDGGAAIKSKEFVPVEKVAPGVVYRKPVTQPLHTGIKSVDALVTIGRGQRELIIGDRGTGKTAIALDAILSQAKEGVICVYCAIGQKNSKVASIVELLKKHKAMDYTVVVNSSASDPATLQYIAPYSATAIAEYFMAQGKDVLVVYDDLSKHAWAYRQMSLVLRRPAGREAYPGDVFYLHSRLLERSCRLDEKYGGGSITSLPIIETLEGDVSAYIPTNVISITDGNIVMDADLFNAGMRPAINVGLSVSRVGGAAQTKAMKKVAGKLKLDLAQYREMAAFSQFESDLDPETKKLLNRGARLTQILKQKNNNPYDLATEIAVLWAVTQGFLDEMPVNEIDAFEAKFVESFHTEKKKLIEKINTNKVLDEADEKEMEKFVKSVL